METVTSRFASGSSFSAWYMTRSFKRELILIFPLQICNMNDIEHPQIKQDRSWGYYGNIIISNNGSRATARR